MSEQWKCLQVSWVLHHIECSCGLVDQWKEAELTQREALKRMDEVFGENKIKHQIFGSFLNNLGVVCEVTSRYVEAASFFRQALDAWKGATDYDGDEDERKRDIALGKLNLWRIQLEMICGVIMHEMLFSAAFQ